MRNIVVILFVTISIDGYTQRPGGGRPGGNREEMIKREKQVLYEKVKDLSNDQKLLVDGIYEEYAITLQEKMKELRQSNDREGRREKMQALRQEKDNLMADVLNEDQYTIYKSISAKRRERREQQVKRDQQ